MDSSWAQIIKDAAARPDVRQAVHQLYAQVQQEIDARRPLCSMSGRCCRFDEFGHRLYVTTLELAAFLADLPPTTPRSHPNAPAGGCPFQAGTICSVHAIRPFGCRIFFCDTTATQWQNEQYERFHASLKSLHAEFSVPYRYVEWRQALIELGFGQI